MGQILFIVWRESVEALLVVGILYAWLKQGAAQTRRGLPYLWGGVMAGVLLAVLLGGTLLLFTEILSGDAQDYFQIAMMLIAAILIVQMVLWMRAHSRTLKHNMQSVAQKSSETANWWGVFVLAMLAVAREGSETVIFLYGSIAGQPGSALPEISLAIVSGFGLAVLSFYLLQLGGRFFSWRYFFKVTEIMLLFLAAGMLMSAAERLMSLNYLPPVIDIIWNSHWLIDDSTTLGRTVASLTGYRAQPSLMGAAIYAAYWGLIALLFRRQKSGSRCK